jgi:transposase-like protein
MLNYTRRYEDEQKTLHSRTDYQASQRKGETIGQACKKIGVSEQTYYRWRREYGGMQVEQAKRLKGLDKENSRLKKLVAELSLDNAILKEVNKGNF